MITEGIYKVVSLCFGGYYSAIVSTQGNKYCAGRLHYAIGEITTARLKSLGVFCFCTKDSAIKFAASSPFRVMLVEGIGVGHVPKLIDYCWVNPSLSRPLAYAPFDLCNTQAGTICFPAIKPIKFIS